jgi:SAM-dependent methyltransferase
MAAKLCREKLGLEVYTLDLPKLKLAKGRFDAAGMWHVLEHLSDPESYIAEIFRLLKPGGKLVIEVPNYDSWTRRVSGRYWLGLDLKYHYHFFNWETLKRVLEKYRFGVRFAGSNSIEYSTFMSTQSLAGRMTGLDQGAFGWLAGRGGEWRAMVQLALMGVLAVPCFLINLALAATKKGEVLKVVAERL